MVLTISLARCSEVLLLAMLVGCERARPAQTPRMVVCEPSGLDTTVLAEVARDTVARLRARPQRIERMSPVAAGGLEFRTEDSSPGALHNGGLVTFDCAGRFTLVWLDGG